LGNSRPRLPTLVGLALQSGAGRGRINELTAIQRGETASEFLVEPGQLSCACRIVFVPQSQSLTNDLARGVVAA
jgi:hypothetical protein